MMRADRADRKALGQAMMNRSTVLFLFLKLGLTDGGSSAKVQVGDLGRMREAA